MGSEQETDEELTDFETWDKLVMQCFLMGYRANATFQLSTGSCVYGNSVTRVIFHGNPIETIA